MSNIWWWPLCFLRAASNLLTAHHKSRHSKFFVSSSWTIYERFLIVSKAREWKRERENKQFRASNEHHHKVFSANRAIWKTNVFFFRCWNDNWSWCWCLVWHFGGDETGNVRVEEEEHLNIRNEKKMRRFVATFCSRPECNSDSKWQYLRCIEPRTSQNSRKHQWHNQTERKWNKENKLI